MLFQPTIQNIKMFRKKRERLSLSSATCSFSTGMLLENVPAGLCEFKEKRNPQLLGNLSYHYNICSNHLLLVKIVQDFVSVCFSLRVRLLIS